MPKKVRMSKINFKELFKQKHGDIYDYSLSNYKGCKKRLKIICRDHGIFKQSPDKHFNRGHGCPDCAGNKRLTTEQFIMRGNKLHNFKYDYSCVVCNGTGNVVIIICKICDEVFSQTPNNHLNVGHGCPSCSTTKKLTTEEFKIKSKKVHGNKYDYSYTIYNRACNKVSILCKLCDKIFDQLPYNHFGKGYGCPSCSSSKGEFKIREYLTKIGVTFSEQKRYIDCKLINTLPFDFYIYDLNLLIEFDGKQHYETIEHFGGEEEFITRQYCDELKNKYAHNNKIYLLRIPYSKFNQIPELINYTLNIIRIKQCKSTMNEQEKIEYNKILFDKYGLTENDTNPDNYLMLIGL